MILESFPEAFPAVGSSRSALINQDKMFSTNDNYEHEMILQPNRWLVYKKKGFSCCCMRAKLLQSCLTLCNSMDCSVRQVQRKKRERWVVKQGKGNLLEGKERMTGS